MLTDNITRQTDNVAAREHHAAALIAALGNPSEWEFTGDVVDGGLEAACACGHAIRWCFHIRHPLRGVSHVGSTCINHIASISPALGAQLTAARDALEARLADAEKRARRAAADTANAALWAQYEALRDAAIAHHNENRAARRMSPKDLWWFSASRGEEYRRMSPPTYTRAADLRKWIEKAIKAAQFALDAE